MKQTNKAAGMAAMSVVVFIYGISYIAREAVGAYLGTTAIVGLQLGIMALLFTIFAYFLNLYALKQIGVTLSNLFLNFMPVVTILAALVLYHTIPTGKQVIGGILIIASVFMLDKDQRNIEKA